MGKPTVLIIDNSVDITGAFNAVFNFAQYAKVHYNFIFVLPTKSRAIKRLKDHGFTVETLPFLEINKNLFNLIFYLPRLLLNGIRINRLVRRYDTKLVHVNDIYNLVGVMAKALGGHFSLITHVRFMPDRFPVLLVTLWMQCNLRYAKAIICVSQAVKRCLLDHPKIQVIYDGLSYNAPATTLTQQPKEQATINLLYLSHYIPGKGQDLALEAFHRAFVQNNKLRLKFVGGDMGLEKNKLFKKDLEERTAALGLKSVVTFTGPTLEIHKEMQNTDIVLNFSESESFSMTCLEALMLGKPLIATDCGGPAELFIHQESSYLVKNRNIKAMTEAILLLGYNEDLRYKFSQNSQDYVRCKFAAENTVKKLREVYDIALGKVSDIIIHDSQV